MKQLLFPILCCLLAAKPVMAQHNNEFDLFFRSFSASLQKRSALPVSDTVNVECYADGSKGGALNKTLFMKKRANIFTDKVIAGFVNYNSKNVERNDEDYYTYTIGFSEWDKDAGMQHEYGFHYHFKRKNGQWQLVMISCVG